MNLKKLTVIAGCLASLTALAQQHPADTSLHRTHIAECKIDSSSNAFFIKSVPLQATISDSTNQPYLTSDCSIVLRSVNSEMFLEISEIASRFAFSVREPDTAEIKLLLQNGRTVTATCPGVEECGHFSEARYDRRGYGEHDRLGPPRSTLLYCTYTFTFILDKNELKSLAKTGIKSARVYPDRNKEHYLNLQVKDNDELRKTSADFLYQYTGQCIPFVQKHLYDTTEHSPYIARCTIDYNNHTFSMESVPIETQLNGESCSLKFWSVDRFMFLKIGGEGAFVLEHRAKFIILLQNDSTIKLEMYPARKEGPMRLCDLYNRWGIDFTINADQMRALTQTGIKSIQLSMGTKSGSITQVKLNDALKKTSTDFLYLYARHFRT